MTWPIDRLRTYNNSDPVNAQDLNAIQDATRFGQHGTREIVIPGALFTPRSPDYTGTVQAFVDDWAFAGGPPNDTIVAGLLLPVGTAIRSIVWHINKASNASGMILSLRRRNGTTGTTIDTVTDTTSGAAYTTNTRSGINYTIASGDAMHLIVQAGATVHRFSHAIMTTDRP